MNLAIKSFPPPGGNGTIKWIGLLGYVNEGLESVVWLMAL